MYELLCNKLSDGKGNKFKGKGTKIPLNTFDGAMARKLIKQGLIQKIKKDAKPSTDKT